MLAIEQGIGMFGDILKSEDKIFSTVSEPQAQSAQSYPVRSPKFSRLTRNAKSAILVTLVLVASIVGSYFYIDSQPKIVVKGFGWGYMQSDNECLSGFHEITRGNWSAILVNTGGSGFADVGFYLDSLQVAHGSFHIPAHSETTVQQTLSINGCYHVTTIPPNDNVVIVSQRADWLTWPSMTIS